jgi:S1-C subfamily serine protease
LGRPIELTIEREGRALALVVQPSLMERTRGEEAEFHDLGLTLSEITGPMVLARQLPVADGLLVTGVRASSPAASSKPQLAVGDVLVKIGGQPVRALGTLRELLSKRGEADLLVALRRGEEELLSLIHPDEKRGGDRAASCQAGSASRPRC